MGKLALIALAGAIGTLARYGLAIAVQDRVGTAFPWGTVAVNLIGCFAFGAVCGAADGRGLISPEWRLILLTGFMGAFTTFSTYIADTGQMLANRELLLAFANITLQIVAGLALYMGGLQLGRGL